MAITYLTQCDFALPRRGYVSEPRVAAPATLGKEKRIRALTTASRLRLLESSVATALRLRNSSPAFEAMPLRGKKAEIHPDLNT
jgi:hypothetical protein